MCCNYDAKVKSSFDNLFKQKNKKNDEKYRRNIAETPKHIGENRRRKIKDWLDCKK